MPTIKSVSSISHHGVRELNEDAILVNEARQIFGVFDGASSLVPYLSSDGKTGAYIAAHLEKKHFSQTQPILQRPR